MGPCDKRFALLVRVIAAVGHATTFECGLQEILDVTLDALALEAGVVVLFDDDAVASLVCQRGLPDEVCSRFESFPVDDPPYEIVTRGEPLLRSRERGDQTVAGFASTASVPLSADGREVGTLSVASRTPREFDADEVTALMAVGREAGEFVKRARAEDEVSRLNRELEALGAERSATLEAVNAALRQEALDRDHAERARHDSETRLRDLALSSADWFWEVDAQGRYVSCSDQVQEVLGYTPDELVGKTPFDLMIEDEAKRIAPIFAEMVATGEGCSELVNRNHHKDGHEVVLLTSCVATVDDAGVFAGFRGVDKDITATVRAQEALRDSEERYRRMFDLEPDALLVIDRDTYRILDANEAATRVYGFTRKELLCLDATDLSAEPEATRETLAAVTSSEGTFVPLRRHRRRSGEEFPVEVTAGEISLGGRALITQAVRDVSERERRSAYTAAVGEIQRRLLDESDSGDAVPLFEIVLSPLLMATRADRVCVFESGVDDDGRLVELRRAEVVRPGVTPLGERLSARGDLGVRLDPRSETLLRNGEPVMGRSIDFPEPRRSALAAHGVLSLLTLPLIVHGDLYGVISLDDCTDGRLWDFSEVALLTTAATALSAALERRLSFASLRARTGELSALLRASRAIASSIDYNEVLREVARAAGEALGSPECVIWEYSAHGDRAEFRCLWEADPKPGLADSLIGSWYDIRTHPGGVGMLRSGTVQQQSVSDEGLPPGDRADMERFGEKTWLTVPLVSADELIGVMILIESAAEREFTDDEMRMARAIGEQAAVALGNARLHSRQEEQNRWLRALVEAGRVIASTLDEEELLQSVVRLAAESVLAPLAFIYEYDAERDVFVTRTRYGAEGLGRVDAIGTVDPVSEAPDDRLALDAGQVFVETVSDPKINEFVRRWMEQNGEKTLVNVPFRFQGEALGMLVLIETQAERVFTAGELEYLSAFGEQVAIAFNNARLYATIAAQATTDGLTGLANHRTFYDRLGQELARAERYRMPVSLLMIDIDDFKVLNDTHGHQAGDEVLRQLGALLAEQLRRDVDLPARYGGEEFAVILPNTTVTRAERGAHDAVTANAHEHEAPVEGHAEGAEALGERLRALIAGTHFPTGVNGDTAHMTVSIGIATYPDTAQNMDDLVARADAALYAAKRTGKDLVQVYRR